MTIVQFLSGNILRLFDELVQTYWYNLCSKLKLMDKLHIVVVEVVVVEWVNLKIC